MNFDEDDELGYEVKGKPDGSEVDIFFILIVIGFIAFLMFHR